MDKEVLSWSVRAGPTARSRGLQHLCVRPREGRQTALVCGAFAPPTCPAECQSQSLRRGDPKGAIRQVRPVQEPTSQGHSNAVLRGASHLTGLTSCEAIPSSPPAPGAAGQAAHLRVHERLALLPRRGSYKPSGALGGLEGSKLGAQLSPWAPFGLRSRSGHHGGDGAGH